MSKFIKTVPEVFATILKVDSVVSTTSYVGKAIPGSATSSAVWQIMKMDENAGVALAWADGNDKFDNVWDNRESLSYT